MFQKKLSLAMLMILSLWAGAASASNADEPLYVSLAHYPQERDVRSEVREDFLPGFLISNNSVYNYAGRRMGWVGEIVDCNGLYGQCLEIKNWIKIYIPADFEFGRQAEWEWQDCKYSIFLFRNFEVLGQSSSATEIRVSCSEDGWFNEALIEYDVYRGVVSFEVKDDGVFHKFFLSSQVGFLANQPTKN